jgi:hypothetical protein
MNLKIRKLIAKEFLVLIGIFILTGLFWLFLILRNSYFENRKDKVKKEMTLIENGIAFFQSKYEFIYDESGALIKDKGLATESSDTILIKLNKRRYTKDGLPILRKNKRNDPLGILKGEKEPSSQAVDSLDSLNSKLNGRMNDLRAYSTKISDREEISSYLTVFGIVILLIIYPVRFLLVSIVWAIRTLRN